MRIKSKLVALAGGILLVAVVACGTPNEANGGSGDYVGSDLERTLSQLNAACERAVHVQWRGECLIAGAVIVGSGNNAYAYRSIPQVR